MNGYTTTVYEPEDNRNHIALRLLDRPIAYHRIFVDLTGSVTAAVMLSQAVYWSRRTKNAAGWFYKSHVEWTDETGLSRKEQNTARTKLREFDWWQEDKRKANGAPTIHYRINLNGLYRELSALATSSGEIEDEHNTLPDLEQSNVRNRTIECAKSDNPINIEYTEITSENPKAGLTPGERERYADSVLELLRTHYKSSPIGNVSSPVQVERKIDEHVDVIEAYGWEEYVRAANVAVRWKDIRYASAIEAQIVRDKNQAETPTQPKPLPSQWGKEVVNFKLSN
jgi:hypothetical protein